MKLFRPLLAVGVIATAYFSAQAIGHHAFSAEFDPNRPLILKGPVTKVEWVTLILGYIWSTPMNRVRKNSGWLRAERQTHCCDVGLTSVQSNRVPSSWLMVIRVKIVRSGLTVAISPWPMVKSCLWVRQVPVLR